MKLSNALEAPQLYQAFQQLGGFFGARLVSMKRHLPLLPGQKIIDIGCGPGHIAKHLPKGVDYIGFDVDETYINFAQKNFGSPNTRFLCRLFDDAAAAEFGPADVVMMNGVLHHIDDDSLDKMLPSIARVLKPGGKLFTLDGVFQNGQSKIAKFLLQNDRGKYVRHEEDYRKVLAPHFESVDGWVHHDMSRIPYSFFVSVCTKGGAIVDGRAA